MKISTSFLALEDKWILMRYGKVVAVVDRGSPVEDLECDEIIVPQADFDAIAAKCALKN